MISRIKMSAWDCSVTFEVDHDKLDLDELKDMHTFWMGHEDTLREFDGNMLYAFLSGAAATAINIQFDRGYHLKGLIEEFDYDERGCGVEGYCKMDGSTGIRIVAIDELIVGDFTAEELD